jgi:hypothetical protein
MEFPKALLRRADSAGGFDHTRRAERLSTTRLNVTRPLTLIVLGLGNT